MYIKTLKINNLRNLKSVSLDLDPGRNYLFGDNGAGKTSVLESIVVLAKGRSFRAGKIATLIGSEAENFRVVANIITPDKSEKILGIERTGSEWKARNDGEDVKQLSDLAGYLPLVLIEPNSHLLVSGPPDGRRRFLDWGVFHVEHDYLVLWRRYTRALKQRNAALRKQNNAMAENLDEILTGLGEKIHAARNRQLKKLSAILKETMKDLSPGLGDVKLRYDKGWKGQGLLSALQSTLMQDLDRGVTGQGPHRADLPVYLNRKPAKDRVSRGEQKIISAALLLSQARLMAESGEKPILLMDDLASDFDQYHLCRVLELAEQLNAQVWITGTSYLPYVSLGVGSHATFHVEHGKITTETVT